MPTPYLAEIKAVSFNFAPRGWALCDGQLLPINQNQALFSLLGTAYGGDGRVNFALPDLRGRVPIHMGNGHTMGERGGEAGHTLSIVELPQHTHPLAATTDQALEEDPTNALPAMAENVLYAVPRVGTVMHPDSIAPAGGSQAHENMQPFLVLNYIIALQGIFPSP